MTTALLQRLQKVVSGRTGLQIRPRDSEAFQNSLAERVKALRLKGPLEYCLLLESNSSPAELEWPELAARLTNRESYFFRDLGQMALLRDQILPELIERNRARRSLRLWSAGCSTGEEPYTLGILLDGLLPRGEAWEVVIIGTDLNPQALALAERGVFGDWSFRTVEPETRLRFFRSTQAGWEIVDRIRRLVTFAPSNLIHDHFPDRSRGLYDLDLILCRNVFIYFEREAIAAVACKLANTLSVGGYLMTGHAEIDRPCPELLSARRFPGSQLYQRVSQLPEIPRVASQVRTRETSAPLPQTAQPTTNAFNAAVRKPSTASAPRLAAPTSGDECPVLDPPGGVTAPPELVLALAARGEYGALIEHLEPWLVQHPDDYAALYLIAQAYTNQARPEMAVSVCLRSCEQNPLASAPYQVLAVLAEDRGDHEEAKRLLKKVLYLSPGSALAYVELAALYASEGERARARKMWSAARELLLGLPPDAALAPWDGPLADEWLLHVEGQLTHGS